MSKALAHVEICAPARSEKADFQCAPKKWATVPHFSLEPLCPVSPFVKTCKAVPRRNETHMTPHKLDALDKRIWWECLKRNHPAQAEALKDENVQNMLAFFKGSLVIS